MNKTSEAIIKACEQLSLEYTVINGNSNCIEVKINNNFKYFINSSIPINTSTDDALAKDKDFQYKILKNVIRFPKTISFFDFNVKDQYKVFVRETNTEEIIKEVNSNFAFPIIIKMNSGNRGNNVYICKDNKEIKGSLEKIFNHNSRRYDYIALAQEYIKPLKEYRVIILDKKIELVYEKRVGRSDGNENISPLHSIGSKAILIKDISLLDKISKFIEPLLNRLDLRFMGQDIIINEDGIPYLIEINSKPGFTFFMRDNGDELIVELYKKILNKLIVK